MAESTAYFAVKSIGLSRLSGGKPCTLAHAARHNLREIQAEHGATGHVDPRRTQYNIIMAGPCTSAEVQANAKELLATVGALKLRRDHCQAIEVVFSLPTELSNFEPDGYFLQCLKWLEGAMRLPVLSAVAHHDEAAKHMHVLLLPLKDGRHVGSTPISMSELKRLRDAFFAMVAGPAGFKRESAKVRGAAKQWAVSAVLHQCEVLGLRAANGPMWPVLANAIKRDPTDSMLALGIDVNSIRPPEEPTSKESQTNPIGFIQKPIGFQKTAPKHQTLSCVGFAHPGNSKEALRATKPLPELRAALELRKESPMVRLGVAKAAMRRVTEREPIVRSPAPLPRLEVRVGDDGLTRERDEYADDLAAWRDY